MTYPNPTNLTGIRGVIIHANTLSGGILMPLTLVALMIITFTLTYKMTEHVGKSLITSSYTTFILSTLLWASGIIDGKIVIIALTITIISSLYLLITRE